VMSVLPSGC